MLTAARAALVGVAVCAAGCAVKATLPERAPCAEDADCLAGEICTAGICSRAAVGCSTDLDCDVAAGAVCRNGACTVPADVADGACRETADCPLNTYCNLAEARCAPLLEGWCRSASHCPDRAPICTSDTTARTGTCVECRSNADCGGNACAPNGTCAVAPVSCPPHSSLVPGSTTTCQCDPGFQPNPTTRACEPATSTDTSTCVPHASPVPGVPGQCRCDCGFQPSADGASCVPEQAPPPPPPPGNDTGDNNGGAVDACGANSFPLFFLCVCYPGYVVNDTATGCVEDVDDACPPNSYDGGDGWCYCFDGYAPNVDGTACVAADGGCPAHSSLYSDGYCYCDAGYSPNSSATACVPDVCAQNGYYGDGWYCDTFCPYADPDCF